MYIYKRNDIQVHNLLANNKILSQTGSAYTVFLKTSLNVRQQPRHRRREAERGDSVVRGEMSGGGGCAGCPGDRRPHTPSHDFQGMVSGHNLMHNIDLPQHLLHIQDSAPLHLRHPYADFRAPHREINGGHAAGEEVHAFWAVELHPQSGSIQHQGARYHHCHG